MEITLDDLQNGYYIYQSKDGFRFGMDAVLLSRFAEIRSSDKVIDLGSGNGIIPILLAANTKAKHFAGLEIQRKSVELANMSVEYNSLNDRIKIVQGDIKNASDIFGKESFTAVVTNPPYMINDHGLKNKDEAKYIARHEALCSFEDVAEESAKLLVSKGRMFMIHRPFRLAELFCTLKKYRLEPKRMRLVHPYIDKPPNMVLIEAVKEGNPRIKIEKPLIIYKAPGVYTEEIAALYRL